MNKMGNKPGINRGDLFQVGPDPSGILRPATPSPRGCPRRCLQPLAHHDRGCLRVDVQLAPCDRARQVLLDVGEGDLPKQSVVVVSHVLSAEKDRLRERIGSLSRARVEQILAGLRFQQASFFRS